MITFFNNHRNDNQDRGMVGQMINIYRKAGGGRLERDQIWLYLTWTASIAKLKVKWLQHGCNFTWLWNISIESASLFLRKCVRRRNNLAIKELASFLSVPGNIATQHSGNSKFKLSLHSSLLPRSSTAYSLVRPVHISPTCPNLMIFYTAFR